MTDEPLATDDVPEGIDPPTEDELLAFLAESDWPADAG